MHPQNTNQIKPKNNTEFLIKIKATLWTGLLIVWFLFFAFRFEWFFKIHKDDPDKDTMEVSLGDLEATVYTKHMKVAEDIPSPIKTETVKLSSPMENTPINTENGTEAISLPPTQTKKKLTPKPPLTKPTVQPRPITPIQPKRNEVTLPPKPQKIIETPRAIYPGNPTQKKPPKPDPKNNNPFSNGTKGTEKGKQGIPNGTAKITPISGNASGTGMSMSSTLKNRGITKIPSFQDKFNQSGTIRVEVRVDKTGNCSFIRITRSNVASAELLSIIKKKLKEIKFKAVSTGEDEFGYIEFKFKVTQ